MFAQLGCNCENPKQCKRRLKITMPVLSIGSVPGIVMENSPLVGVDTLTPEWMTRGQNSTRHEQRSLQQKGRFDCKYAHGPASWACCKSAE